MVERSYSHRMQCPGDWANTHALAPGATAPSATVSTSLIWGGGDLVAIGSNR
ncbi:hypothetical protein AMTRI_Chr04g187500 [Amborella trichopoda]